MTLYTILQDQYLVLKNDAIEDNDKDFKNMWEGLSAVLNLQNYTMALSIYNNKKILAKR